MGINNLKTDVISPVLCSSVSKSLHVFNHQASSSWVSPSPTHGGGFNPRFLSHQVHIPNIMGFSSVALSWSFWLASVYVHELTLIMIISPCLLSPVGTFHQLLHLQKQRGALIFSFWRKGHSVSSILNCVSNRASMGYPQMLTNIDKALSWESSKM